MATPQFNRKEVVGELLDREKITISLLISFAEKNDKEIYELYKKLKK
jgi:hypothetical protein